MNASRPIVIAGPTASGKSDLAMRVAIEFDGEIICADSRTVYKGLDIGTAKPTAADRRRVAHHVLDVVSPAQRFSAAEFKQRALEAIVDIKTRGKLPVIVGGTGLYIDGLIRDYNFGPKADADLRTSLYDMSVEELQKVITNKKLRMPRNLNNKAHLIREIERNGQVGKSNNDVINDYVVVGLFPEKTVLRSRIYARAESIFSSNVIEETTLVASQYGWECPGLSGNIYPILRRMINQEIDREEAVRLFVAADWQLARRQMTWFRRHDDFERFETADAAYAYIVNTLKSP